jgi:hypothetical protein
MLLFVASFAAWADEPISETQISEAPITDAERSHWAFTPPVRPPLPAVKDAAWLRTPIDAFILARLEAEHVSPAPPAARSMLLRRLSFDLIGLPPSPEELSAFETAPAPDAFEREVDRLLASPAFGERAGQYWLDLARFGETDGFEHDKVRPEAWRYRDWVIAALNADVPYDEFVRWQLAGEGGKVQGSGFGVQEAEGRIQQAVAKGHEPEEKRQPAIATMFCLAGPDMPDLNDQAERRHVLLNEMTGTVGAVLLGLQIGCAQCHDHKYDPLSQADFYRLRAVFEPAVATLKRDVPFNLLAEQKDAAPARLWIRGDHKRPGPELEPAFPRIADPIQAKTASQGNLLSSRLPSLTPRANIRGQFTAWLMHESNPLTSRVMANRIWQHHFGRGLCQSPSDFGVMGGEVTNPELLDWLAVEFRESGWAMKRLSRLLVSSATYRQGSSPAAAAADRYASFPRRRLEGEAIRDALLAAAGLLTSERGGPGVMPPLPPELVRTLLKGQWTASKREADHYKRSIYVFARRNLRYPIFEAFDRPDGNATCPVRGRSTTAPQSLLLFNSELSLLAARHLAGRILAKASEPAGQIEQLYVVALARRPRSEETKALAVFLTEQRQRLVAETRPRGELALPPECPPAADEFAAAALVDACLAILNTNEFIYVD